jgi:hypothetical protein
MKRSNGYDTQLNIVITKEMHQLLIEEAAKRGISVAEYVRSRLFQMRGKRGPGPIALGGFGGDSIEQKTPYLK